MNSRTRRTSRRPGLEYIANAQNLARLVGRSSSIANHKYGVLFVDTSFLNPFSRKKYLEYDQSYFGMLQQVLQHRIMSTQRILDEAREEEHLINQEFPEVLDGDKKAVDENALMREYLFRRTNSIMVDEFMPEFRELDQQIRRHYQLTSRHQNARSKHPSEADRHLCISSYIEEAPLLTQDWGIVKCMMHLKEATPFDQKVIPPIFYHSKDKVLRSPF